MIRKGAIVLNVYQALVLTVYSVELFIHCTTLLWYKSVRVRQQLLYYLSNIMVKVAQAF